MLGKRFPPEASQSGKMAKKKTLYFIATGESMFSESILLSSDFSVCLNVFSSVEKLFLGRGGGGRRGEYLFIPHAFPSSFFCIRYFPV